MLAARADSQRISKFRTRECLRAGILCTDFRSGGNKMAAKEAAKKLKITLVRSTIGQVPKARATVAAMGLRKLNQTVELPDNAATRGQIQRVRHMVKVEEA